MRPSHVPANRLPATAGAGDAGAPLNVRLTNAMRSSRSPVPRKRYPAFNTRTLIAIAAAPWAIRVRHGTREWMASTAPSAIHTG